MLEVFANFIGTTILSFAGYYVIKKITGSTVKLNLKRILLLLFMALISVSLLRIKTTGIYSIVVILLNTIIYKYVFDISIEEATLANGMLMVNLFLSDLITAQILCIFVSVEAVRTTLSLILLANIVVAVLLVMLINIKPLIYQYQKFYNNSKKGVTIIHIIFVILLIIGAGLLVYNVVSANILGSDYIVNTIVMLIMLSVTFIYIQNRNKYTQLSTEYDNLFLYIQNFEEWIEKEQFNRHEYKNQLAVLRYLTKEKKVKEKIDEILQDNINLEGDVVNQLKDLPKGGIKGLMYYKAIIAQKNKIKLNFDVSINNNSYLERLEEKHIKILCRLIGVYFDNAIEAAAKTKKKQVLIEVYDLKGKVNFVFSNTFNNNQLLKNRNEKGTSTKGPGRGNGLYFASKLLSKNNWLTQKQEIIDNYYIQKLEVNFNKINTKEK